MPLNETQPTTPDVRKEIEEAVAALIEANEVEAGSANVIAAALLAQRIAGMRDASSEELAPIKYAYELRSAIREAADRLEREGTK